MKRISKKEASEKYGIVVSGANSMNTYYLREDGCVVDDCGDIRYIPQRRFDLLRQATFLRGLRDAVNAYNRTPCEKIEMGWLVKQLADAANECEQEAEV